MKQNSSDNATTPCLHDCVALGEFEQGLSTSIEPRPEELARLPTLLRLLSACRPLVSVATSCDDNNKNNSKSNDSITRMVSQRLEDRAAIYSSAESVEAVACHLAPAVCRRISRWKQLESVVSGPGGYPVGTTTSPSSASTSKRRKVLEGTTAAVAGVGAAPLQDDVLRATSDDEGMDTTTDRSEDEDYQQQKRKRIPDPLKDTGVVATLTNNTDTNDDSDEARASKMLHELILLVQHEVLTAKSKRMTALSIDDFVLAQETRQTAITMGQCDLGAILVSLMHHAPVLQHKQVASALCRASLPQAATLIGCMGANVPTAVPSLVRGVLNAYNAAISGQDRQEEQQEKQHQQHRNVVSNTSRKAIHQLARLSPREGSRIRTMLRQEKAMIDVQLELVMEQDDMEVLCLLIHEFRQQVNDHGARTETVASSTSMRNTNSDFIERSLVQHLTERADLLVKILQFFSKTFRLIDESPSWSESSFVFSACIWTLCQVPVTTTVRKNSKVGEALLTLLDALEYVGACFCKTVEEENVSDSETTMTAESILDRPFSLYLCLLVSAFMAVCPGDATDDHRKDPFTTKFATALQNAMQTKSFSQQSSLAKATISLAITGTEPGPLCSTMENILGVTEKAILSRSARITSMASAVCLYFREHQQSLSSSIAAFSEQHAVADPEGLLMEGFALIAFLASDLFPLAQRRQKAKQALSVMLEDKTSSLSFLQRDLTSKVMCSCLQTMLKENHTKIPFVMPIKLEIIAMECVQYGFLDTTYAAFLLNLLYCLEFLEREPDSPFKIDPRAMPLKEVYAFCGVCSVDTVHPTLAERLKSLIAKHAPEIPFRACARQVLESYHRQVAADETNKSVSKERNRLKNVLRDSLRVKERDPSGSRAEKAFLTASLILSDSDLFTTTMSALTSTAGKPDPFFSYSMLYRDPLVVLKCPLDVFERKGWQRIVVYLLQALIETNDFIALSAEGNEAFGEFRFARNEVLLRSLASTFSQGMAQQCSMTVGLVRRTLAEGRGVVAMFVRQADTDETVDWLVENVPESIEDWNALSNLLCDSVPMTPLERLVTADKILRIVVVQGHRYDKESLSLASSAFSRFISSFFLVIGPVGVPVSSLLNDSTGVDATKIARKAGFRILEALTRVRGYRRNLVNESGLCLQKLAGLCKGEGIVSGLSGSVVQRQKVFLKEFLDAIHRAADSMGSASQV